MSWWALAMVPADLSAPAFEQSCKGLTLVKGKLGVNLGGNSTGDDLEELLTETNKESVHGVLGLLLLVTRYQSRLREISIWWRAE
jgi:hypothetical protein